MLEGDDERDLWALWWGYEPWGADSAKIDVVASDHKEGMIVDGGPV